MRFYVHQSHSVVWAPPTALRADTGIDRSQREYRHRFRLFMSIAISDPRGERGRRSFRCKWMLSWRAFSEASLSFSHFFSHAILYDVNYLLSDGTLTRHWRVGSVTSQGDLRLDIDFPRNRTDRFSRRPLLSCSRIVSLSLSFLSPGLSIGFVINSFLYKETNWI